MVCTRRKKNIFVKQKDISSNGPLLLLLFLLSKQFSFEKLFEEEEREIGGGILVHFGPNGVTD